MFNAIFIKNSVLMAVSFIGGGTGIPGGNTFH
jgi:hypothetical protein